MSMVESHWRNHFQESLFRVNQAATGELKGSIGFVHGIGEHIGRYSHVFDFFTQHGFSCYGFDSFGHGKSMGKRGHIRSLEQWMDEINMLIDWMRADNPNKPVVLYGHSLGGNKVLNYTLRHRNLPDATIATSPFIGEGTPSPKAKIVVGRFLGKYLPGVQIENGLVKNALSHDQSVNDNYLSDKLVHPKVSLGMGAISLDAAAWLKEGKHKVDIPLLVTHGDEDKLTDFESSRQFVEQSDGDVTFKAWPGFYHETHNELEKQAVFEYTLNWINTKIG